MTKPRKCPECGGVKRVGDIYHAKTCPACNGTGEAPEIPKALYDPLPPEVLADARQDRVHMDRRSARAGRAAKAVRCEAPEPTAAEVLAREFHALYEELAPEYGYETRLETREFDPESPNGKLMIAVCSRLSLAAERDELQAEVAELKARLGDER